MIPLDSHNFMYPNAEGSCQKILQAEEGSFAVHGQQDPCVCRRECGGSKLKELVSARVLYQRGDILEVPLLGFCVLNFASWIMEF